ncbi:RNA polymerase sigma-70 factor (ECF subfamily) [Actinomadura rupiterrae]|nr:RNA polymerase sigma factor [Actinomadura rupiterrae]MCP2338048.1 RNA polymerase sigma-70 factor (ECF subfamily) [Actinomadura rupiterrae]
MNEAAETDDGPLDRAVAAARAGDEAAFRLLYRDVQPRLLRYVRVLVNEDAEDVTSEAWLQIARDLHGFEGGIDGFRGWAATVARHRALDHLRARSRRPVADLPVDELITMPAEGDTAVQAMDGLATGRALAMISGLPADQGEAVMLRVVLGLSAPAAAKVLGKKPGAVRTAAYRGLRKLADQLARPRENGSATLPDGPGHGAPRDSAAPRGAERDS